VPLDLIAVTAFGLESVVVRELADLGYEAKPISTGRVLFQGDERAIARANLFLRTADRILVRVGSFRALDFGELFDLTKLLEWDRWIGPREAFPVNGRSVKSRLSSVPACQRIVKKAIVERLKKGHRVEALPESAQYAPVTIEVSLLEDVASLTIDTSGDGLHKRGYRPMVGEAALKETLAAGLILLSNWEPRRPLIDPFCGTGTIAIEAAMIALDLAPGRLRTFAASEWASFPGEPWDDAEDEAEERAEAAAADKGRLKFTIHASDIDERALTLARKHAQVAGVERHVHFTRRDFAELSSKAEYGCIITNPPYGVRMGEEEQVEELYRSMPEVFRRLPTWSFHVLSARLDLERLVGKEASRRRKLFNSQIECGFFSFLGPKPPWMQKAERATPGAAAPASAEAASEQAGAPAPVAEAPSAADDDGTEPQAPAFDGVELAEVTPDLPEPEPTATPTESASASEQVLLEEAEDPDPTFATAPEDADADAEPDGAERTADGIEDDDIRGDDDDDVSAAIDGDDADDNGNGNDNDGNDADESGDVDGEDEAEGEDPAPEPAAASTAPTPGVLRDRDLKEAAEFAACLANNARHLRRWPTKLGITCYRVYDRDAPDVPLIIDRYEDHVHVAEYERGHSRNAAQQAAWYDLMQAKIAEVLALPVDNVVMKCKPRQRGLSQHERQADSGEFFEAHESGLKFLVNVRDYIDTGLFLDHRQTRAMVRDQSEGKRFLNLFCYTGSFTVYAAAGGAATTTSVDLSNTYLDWAQRNMALNAESFTPARGPARDRFVRSDVLDFLDSHDPGPQYDLAVVDPPTFSNSKSTREDWEVQHGHVRLITGVARLMSPGGLIYFSTNFRRFKLDEEAMLDAGLQWREISRRTVPPDFRNKRIHRCWRLVVG
jgi:putative N6-adenine-specific DNA methylase